MKAKALIAAISLACLFGTPALAAEPSSGTKSPTMVLIPAGKFEMGDHHGFVDPKHGGDETPIHTVRLDAFYVGIYDVTTQQYCEFLNSALGQKMIEVRQGGVYLSGGQELLCETREMSPYSRIGWDGSYFTVLDRKENHPIVCIRWPGAELYCNWLSAQQTKPLCYSTSTWDCDFNKSGYRLPTEAEWEYASRGGQQNPYRNFPWGDDADATKANWPESRNPYRTGPLPWTTPVGFFDGKVHQKAEFAWPGTQETFQSGNGVNGYGLYDMAGNVWQFINDWYERDYYAYSPAENPPGPERGSIMPDGKPYRGMRGGNWYNGENGHSRVSNRNPSYWRGPQDPNHPYYHISFRVVLPVNAESRPVVKPTPVQRVARQDGGGGWPPRDGMGPQRNAGSDNRPPRAEAAPRPASTGSFILRSSEVEDGGRLPREFTGDGAAATLPLEWSGAPEGTKSYAVIMHHIAPDATKWYWILYSIPAEVHSLPKNVKGVGILGNNSVNERQGYAPPMSKGPGEKTYIYTVYALSATPQISAPPAKVNREVLLAAMQDRILATAELQVVYSRPEGATEQREGGRPEPRANGQDGPPGGGPVGRGGPRLLPRSVEEDLNLTEDQRRQLDDLEKEAFAKLAKILTPEQQRLLEQSRPPRPQDGNAGDNPPPDRDNRPPRPDDRGQADNPSPDDRPSRPDDRGGGNRGSGGGGRGESMAENKLPTSPNAGQTVGLYLNTPQAFNGYTLFAPKHNTVTYLMNNQGQVVHQWKSDYEPGQSCYLLPNGHLLRAGMLKVQGGTGGGEGGRIEEFDWDGKLIWAYEHASRDYQLHHDIKPLPNGHVLALMVERKTIEQAVAAGFDRRNLRDDSLVPDAVVEIEPILPKGGKIVWEWHVWDHLIQDNDRSKANYGDVAAHPELVDVNCNGRASPAFWNHMNSLDYNPKLDQILLTVRGCNEIWVIDHATTTQEAASHAGGTQGKGGDLIYRWGNPAAYRRGTMRDKQLIQQHDAEWVADGYPGAGHITIFNNGYERGWSSIEEIVPPVDASGHYLLVAGKAYGPDKPVWHYEAKNRTDFFSAEISGAHRLPNGNTLICAGVIGNLFEITSTGETVWQYVNAMVRNGILAQGEVPGKDMRGHLWNAVFKIHRYAPDYPGLAGRDLTPKGVIELPASQKGKTGLDNWSEQPRDNRDRPGQGSQQRQPRRN